MERICALRKYENEGAFLMDTTDSTSYPQFIQAQNTARGSVADKSDLTAFRAWPAISSLPKGIISVEELPNS